MSSNSVTHQNFQNKHAFPTLPFHLLQPQTPQSPLPFSKFVVAAATTGATAVFVSVSSNDRHHLFLHNALNSLLSSENSLPLWGSLNLVDSGVPVMDSKTGSAFPLILEASQKLCGIGVRRKCILGLKKIDVYAFGVYADDDEIKKCLSDKYGKFSASELKGSKEFTEDLLENDIHTTIRLQIVYGKLSIRSMRSASEESVGSRLMKYGGPNNKELLQRFTSQFSDEIKIPRGSVIHLVREKGHVLCTTNTEVLEPRKMG